MARFETVEGIGKLLTTIPESDNNWRLPDRASPPPPLKSCDDVKSDEKIFFPDGNGSLTCRVSDVMDQVARTHLEHFLLKYEHDTQRYLREGFDNMVQGWADMADSDEDTCGFDSEVDDQPGFVGNCLTLCLEIKDHHGVSDFQGVLFTFDTFFQDRFHSKIAAATTALPESRTACESKIANVFRNMARFESYLYPDRVRKFPNINPNGNWKLPDKR